MNNSISDEKIMSILKKIFEKEFECDPALVTLEAKVYEELGLDSLDSVDLIVALENEFNFKINRVKDEATLREIRTIADIICYIRSKEEEFKTANPATLN